MYFRSDFRKGLVQGDKPIIYPILEWLLRRIPELQKRAYLARYLVKVDVPPDFMAEDQIADLHQQVSTPTYYLETVLLLVAYIPPSDLENPFTKDLENPSSEGDNIFFIFLKKKIIQQTVKQTDAK